MFRATKVAAYLREMERRGFEAKRLLAGAHLDAERVPLSESLISLKQYHAVVANMMQLAGNPGIAFELGKLAAWSDFGIVGYAMIAAPTLRESMRIWLQYSSPLVGTPFKLDAIHDVAGGWEVFVSTPGISGAMQRFAIEENVVQGREFLREITGEEPVIARASFAYPAPPHRALYDAAFGCPLEFDASHTVLVMRRPYLDAPVRRANDELFAICEQRCRQVAASLADAGTLLDSLRQYFSSTPGKLPSLDMASSALGVSVSTLCRQLDTMGQSYQAIKDEFRFRLAREYLLDGGMPPKEVAYRLGFNSPSTFSRAFKSWAGQTIGQFVRTERCTGLPSR